MNVDKPPAEGEYKCYPAVCSVSYFGASLCASVRTFISAVLPVSTNLITYVVLKRVVMLWVKGGVTAVIKVMGRLSVCDVNGCNLCLDKQPVG